jgi:hypothetical protein
MRSIDCFATDTRAPTSCRKVAAVAAAADRAGGEQGGVGVARGVLPRQIEAVGVLIEIRQVEADLVEVVAWAGGAPPAQWNLSDSGLRE